MGDGLMLVRMEDGVHDGQTERHGARRRAVFEFEFEI